MISHTIHNRVRFSRSTRRALRETDAGKVQHETLECRRLLSGIAPEQLMPPVMAGPDNAVEHLVRMAYLIPSNRTPQADGVAKLQQAMNWFHNWYSDQMWRNGFSEKSFRYETEADGVTPMVHVTSLPETDSYYRDDEHGGQGIWGRVLSGAQSAGIGVWSAGQVWLLVFEGHIQHPDGSATGGFFGGTGNGSGSGGGTALLGSDSLAIMRPEHMADDRAYAGMIFPEFGPYPMVQGVTYPSFCGETLSEIASSFFGGYLHEMSHGFGIVHDFRSDMNFHGGLMGNGHRGFRGNIYPARYPNDHVQLSYGMALALNSSRYFNSEQVFTDSTVPVVSNITAGPVTPVNGLVRVNFTAEDDVALASALLYRYGELVDAMPLWGTSFSGTLSTPWYDAGTTNPFTVMVYDSQGNRRETAVTITPQAGVNRAPLPFVRLDNYTPMIGQSVTLDASLSSDPDHPTWSLMVQWDLNGDGIFDTPLATEKAYVASFGGVSVPRRIRLRVVDPAGAEAISEPLGIRVVPSDWYPPQVNSSDFIFATAPHKLRFTFSENVWGSLGLEDLVLENLTTGSTVPASSMFLALGANDDATVTFPGYSGAVLPDGHYRATLSAAGIRDGAGNTLGADHVYEFRFLRGDADNDGQVDLVDFNILAANFGLSGRDFTQGDFNYDNRVTLADFNILAGRFGVVVGPSFARGADDFGWEDDDSDDERQA